MNTEDQTTPNSYLRGFAAWLRSLGSGPRAESDADLLRLYASRRDEMAFAELLRRHGPLVWGVCRRSLAREQDAEDAFQATFLVLARKADTIRKGASLASWLIGVARRTANVVRMRADRPVPELPSPSRPGPEEEAASAELCEVILDEVRRLPDKYRLPLLLCGLEGLTKAEAARRLGWKEGTVSGRLARARDRLQARLVRRGIVSTSVALLGLAVPPALTAQTVSTVVQLAGTRVPAHTIPELVALEVLRMMRTRWLPVILTVVVSSALVLASVGLAYYAHYGPVVAETPQTSEPAPQPVPGEPCWQERLHLQGSAGGSLAGASPDGSTLTTVNDKDLLFILDTATWKERGGYDLGARYGTHYTIHTPFASDGRLFAIMGGVPEAKGSRKRRPETTVLETATGKELYRLPGHSPSFSPAGQLLATVVKDTVRVWDLSTGKERHQLATGGDVPRGYIGPVRFSPDGRRLFAATKRGSGKLWDVTTGREIATLAGFLPTWSPDSRVLATVSPGPVVHLWDAETGAMRARLEGFSQPGCHVAFAPDGRSLLTNVSEYGLKPDGTPDFPSRPKRYKPKKIAIDIRLWDTATGKERLRLPGQTQFCRAAHFAPDGRTIAYQRLTDGPGYRMEAVLWDVAGGKERAVLRDPAGIEIWQFTPDSSAVVGTVGSGPAASVRFWAASTGQPLPALPLSGMGEPSGCCFLPNGKTLALSLTVPGSSIGAPVAMQLRIFQWSAEPLARESRGEAPPPAPPPPEQPATRSAVAQAFAAIEKQVQEAEAGLAKQYAAAAEGEKEALARKRGATLAGFVAQARELARKNPEDPAGVEALEFALRLTAGGADGPLGEQGQQTLTLVREQFLKTPAMERLVPWLTNHHTQEAESLLQTVLDSHPQRVVRGRAGYWLAHALHERAEAAQLLRQVPELRNHPAVKQRPEFVRYLEAMDPQATTQRATAIYERLGLDYADVKLYDFQPATLGEAAKRALFALRNLAVGQTAPEIEGVDLDGHKFKLSEYRGKVVVLIFCGHWCGPCRQMNPFKQELVKRHAGQPFALLEVNSDDDPDEWKRIMKKQGYTWRCWADGGKEGPIAQRWNVTSWPTIVVLDGRGIIRFKGLRDELLGKVVEELLGPR